MGIAVVIPNSKILETLRRPELVAMRERTVIEMKKRLPKTTPDVAPTKRGPVKVDLPFDEALRRAVRVSPLPRGWRTLDQAERSKRTRKRKGG
jgi:hypothetical protein